MENSNGNEVKANKWAVGVGILLPLLLIAAVVIGIYVPRFRANPETDFIFVATGDVTCVKNYFVITSGKISTSSTSTPEYCKMSRPVVAPDQNLKLYRYEVAANNVREISLADAQKLKLDPSALSPDGYRVENIYTNQGIFEIFGGRRNDSLYLTGKTGSKQINLRPILANPWEFQFIAWIIS